MRLILAPTRAALVWVALICAVLSYGCTARAQAQWILDLPSGERVTIVREDHQSFENVSHEQKRILAIDYMTDHPMSDIDALQMEARRVFAAYKTRIDVSDYNTVSLAAEAKCDRGDCVEGRPYYFERQPDGQWLLQP